MVCPLEGLVSCNAFRIILKTLIYISFLKLIHYFYFLLFNVFVLILSRRGLENIF